ncbi:MAG: hypothetical protein KAX47_11330 [Zoogloea sp.]|nr:hypothetical protein [Zoogloea sp.]
MHGKHILAAFLLLSAVNGGVDTYLDMHHIPEPGWWLISSSLLAMGIVFAWYHFDSNARGYPRSRWLNISMVMVSLLALPYYLIRSRPNGEKFRVLLKYVGFCLLSILCQVIGGAVGASID